MSIPAVASTEDLWEYKFIPFSFLRITCEPDETTLRAHNLRAEHPDEPTEHFACGDLPIHVVSEAHAEAFAELRSTGKLQTSHAALEVFNRALARKLATVR